jgi:hypothetical protein
MKTAQKAVNTFCFNVPCRVTIVDSDIFSNLSEEELLRSLFGVEGAETMKAKIAEENASGTPLRSCVDLPATNEQGKPLSHKIFFCPDNR